MEEQHEEVIHEEQVHEEQPEVIHAEEPAVVEPVAIPPQPLETLEPIEEVPAQPVSFKGTPEAGLQRIRAAITLLRSHSAANVGGSLIGDAVRLLEQGYSILAP